jgi:hypothetical protein
MPAFVKEDEGRESIMKIMLFIKEILIPLATENRGLIVLQATNDCSFSCGLENELRSFIIKMGSKIPFTVLCIT